MAESYRKLFDFRHFSDFLERKKLLGSVKDSLSVVAMVTNYWP